MFKGRKLVIATNHKKEQVIAHILEKKIGVTCFTPKNINTDSFGTFSGEINRENDPITTARNKCLLAMGLTSCDLAVSSEGSFGPHPAIYFAPSDDEFLMFMDNKNKLEIIVRELSVDTNFKQDVVNSQIQLEDFANSVGFPSHGLIARHPKDMLIEKGIVSWDKLYSIYEVFMDKYGEVYLETDMRAMFNPTRMKVIKKATNKLVKKINALCPSCQTPGFGITKANPGLPCESCGFPTRSTLSFTYSCSKCTYTKEDKYPNKKITEEPMYCDICNP